MVSTSEKIQALEDEIKRTQKNKATEHHIGSLYGKIAKLKQKMDKESKGGGKGVIYGIKKSGDATVVLIGFPSVGKSTLINAITNADSRVAAYDFTTLVPIPGMMEYNEANIQIIDLPGIISEASKGRGRGKEILSMVRSADLVLIILDVKKPEHLDIIRKELYNAGIRLDRKPPKVIIKKKLKGGVKVLSTYTLTQLSEEMIASLMRGFGMVNSDIIIRENVSIDNFMDVVLGNRHYVQSQLVFNKIDILSKKELKALKKKYPDAVYISAKNNIGFDNLKKTIFDRTRIMRIYLKPQGKEPDMKNPLIMHKGDRIYDVCLKVHKNFVEFFRYSLVWGKSARFPAQKLGLNHILKDGDIVSIII